ncbi:MAG: MarR family winged helix-turn-helix transcriptional regulator [Candidatus Kapaibacteriota bacterium]|jgi:DNA-binding MarR family transcriptional regulator
MRLREELRKKPENAYVAAFMAFDNTIYREHSMSEKKLSKRQRFTSSFSPQRQVLENESRIVAALERLSEAFRVLLWKSGKEHKISPIAVQILTFLNHHRSELCTVGAMADEFNMTKQTLSEAVNSLEAKGFVEKKANTSDARSLVISLTESGKKLAEEVGMFANPLEQMIAELSLKQQESLLDGLLSLIHTLNAQDIVSTQRMCFTCKHYSTRHLGHEHFCQLLQLPLQTLGAKGSEAHAPLRLDCQEHEPANA